LLLSSIPELRRGWLDDVMKTRAARAGLTGVPDSSAEGCPFYKRCPLAIKDVCNKEPVPVRKTAGGHRIACHREIQELLEDQLAPA
jgi:peptide/nickel transport system ATP-binding protein